MGKQLAAHDGRGRMGGRRKGAAALGRTGLLRWAAAPGRGEEWLSVRRKLGRAREKEGRLGCFASRAGKRKKAGWAEKERERRKGLGWFYELL